MECDRRDRLANNTDNDSSVSPDRFSLKSNSVLVNDHYLYSVSCVDVTLSNRINNVLSSVLYFFNVIGESLDEVVVPDELIIKDGRAELAS